MQILFSKIQKVSIICSLLMATSVSSASSQDMPPGESFCQQNFEEQSRNILGKSHFQHFGNQLMTRDTSYWLEQIQKNSTALKPTGLLNNTTITNVAQMVNVINNLENGKTFRIVVGRDIDDQSASKLINTECGFYLDILSRQRNFWYQVLDKVTLMAPQKMFQTIEGELRRKEVTMESIRSGRLQRLSYYFVKDFFIHKDDAGKIFLLGFNTDAGMFTRIRGVWNEKDLSDLSYQIFSQMRYNSFDQIILIDELQ